MDIFATVLAWILVPIYIIAILCNIGEVVTNPDIEKRGINAAGFVINVATFFVLSWFLSS